ncbi:hypothetical protein AAAC51_22625 [Priestia megaterium]
MRNVVRTSKVTQYGKDIQQAMRKMPAAGIDKAKKMYDAVLDTKLPRFLPQEVPVGVSTEFAQQTVRDVLKSTAKNTMQFINDVEIWYDKDAKRYRNKETGQFTRGPNLVHEAGSGNVQPLEVPVVESVTVNKQNDSMKGTSVFDSDLVKAYLKDVESKTRLKVHKIQVEFLKESLRNNKFEKLTPKETAKHRGRFTTSLKNKLIEEWEEKTNQKWPRYTEEVYDQSGEIARHIGQPYDAHHLIENNFSGPHEWWNIHPAKYPDEHQQGFMEKEHHQECYSLGGNNNGGF